jgi:hypothetical protein
MSTGIVFYVNHVLAIHKMSLTVRPIEHNDAEICGKIGYEAHKVLFTTNIH